METDDEIVIFVKSMININTCLHVDTLLTSFITHIIEESKPHLEARPPLMLILMLISIFVRMKIVKDRLLHRSNLLPELLKGELMSLTVLF